MLPKIQQIKEKKDFLNTYLAVYLKEEILAEGIIRKAGVKSEPIRQVIPI